MKNPRHRDEVLSIIAPSLGNIRKGWARRFSRAGLFTLAVSLAGASGGALTCALAAPTTAVWLSPSAVVNVDYGIGWDTGVNVGYWVKPTTDVTVTQLGFYDYLGDGLLDAAAVAIFDSAQNLLISVDLPSGAGATLRDGFRWIAIPPLTLTAGQSYFIDAIPNFNPVVYTVSYSSVTLSTPEIVVQSASTHFIYDGPGFHFPTVSVGYASILGPSLAIEREGNDGPLRDGNQIATTHGSGLKNTAGGHSHVRKPRHSLTQRPALSPVLAPVLDGR